MKCFHAESKKCASSSGLCFTPLRSVGGGGATCGETFTPRSPGTSLSSGQGGRPRSRWCRPCLETGSGERNRNTRTLSIRHIGKFSVQLMVFLLVYVFITTHLTCWNSNWSKQEVSECVFQNKVSPGGVYFVCEMCCWFTCQVSQSGRGDFVFLMFEPTHVGSAL